jgi:hypothetical protein
MVDDGRILTLLTVAGLAAVVLSPTSDAATAIMSSAA